MMISPQTFAEEHKDCSYKELLKVRDELLKEIHSFEKGKTSKDGYCVDPSPEVEYQCNLEYLSELLRLISKAYNREVIWDNQNV